MNNYVKVSVLMTAYNAQKYIAPAITGILGQTFSDFEFIILDDASTDETWLIIQRFARQDKRIIALQNQNNLGIAQSRNKLVSLAKGKYIVWQDADDISLVARIEKLYNFMEKNPEVGICGGWLKFFNEKNYTSVRKYSTDDKTLRKKIFRYSPVAQPASIIRRKVFEQTGGYEKKYSGSEDLHMSFKIGQNYKFANLPEVLLKYRQQSGSITFRKLRKIERQTLKIRREFLKNKNYRFCTLDACYNLGQLLTLYLFPPRLRVGFFNFIRNTK